jgi:hypothetical protein
MIKIILVLRVKINYNRNWLQKDFIYANFRWNVQFFSEYLKFCWQKVKIYICLNLMEKKSWGVVSQIIFASFKCDRKSIKISPGSSFVQDYLRLAWRDTYGTKHNTIVWTRSTMLGKTNKVKYDRIWINV